MTSDDLKLRTKQFTLRCLKIVRALPASPDGRALGNQLARSAMSVGANYRAACRSRSRAEFASKVGLVLEEADESVFWLELVIEARMIKPSLVEPLLKEANELTAIFASSSKTSRLPQVRLMTAKS